MSNQYAALEGTRKGGPLGSSLTAKPTIKKGEKQTTTVEIPKGATSLDVAIGGVSAPKTDLDLFVYDANGKLVGRSANADAEESVSLADPAAGTYTIQVVGFDVPSGTAAYDYRDTFYSTTLGSVTNDGAAAVKLGTGESARFSANVTAAAPAAEGRDLVGEVRLVNARGTVAGMGMVKIEKFTQ